MLNKNTGRLLKSEIYYKSGYILRGTYQNKEVFKFLPSHIMPRERRHVKQEAEEGEPTVHGMEGSIAWIWKTHSAHFSASGNLVRWNNSYWYFSQVWTNNAQQQLKKLFFHSGRSKSIHQQGIFISGKTDKGQLDKQTSAHRLASRPTLLSRSHSSHPGSFSTWM